jgi:hypothetical protein
MYNSKRKEVVCIITKHKFGEAYGETIVWKLLLLDRETLEVVNSDSGEYNVWQEYDYETETLETYAEGVFPTLEYVEAAFEDCKVVKCIEINN